jgi:hypothetical protein
MASHKLGFTVENLITRQRLVAFHNIVSQHPAARSYINFVPGFSVSRATLSQLKFIKSKIP